MRNLKKYFNAIIRFLGLRKPLIVGSFPIIVEANISTESEVVENPLNLLSGHSLTLLQNPNELLINQSGNTRIIGANLEIVSVFKPNPLGLQPLLNLFYSHTIESTEK